jgi:hypothetical protein
MAGLKLMAPTAASQPGEAISTVVFLDGKRSYPDLARFPDEVVLPIGADAGS